MLPDNCQFDGPIPEDLDVLAPAVLEALGVAIAAPVATDVPDFKEPAVHLSAPLDARDIALVQTTLGMVAKLGLNTVGKVIFLKVLKLNPKCAELFSFGTMDPALMWKDGSPAVAHSIKVVQTVATAISLLGDLGTLVP